MTRVLGAKRVVLMGLLAVAVAGVSLAVTVLVGPFRTKETVSSTAEAFAARGAGKLKAAYGEWVKQHDANGGDRDITIALGYWKALSASFTNATGLAKLNLIDGSVSVTVSALPAGEWDVWLVDNRPGRRQGIRPEPSDTMIKVGRLVRSGDTARLDAELGPAAFHKFHVDLVAVAPAGGDPGATGLLFGAPPLFQRLYTALRSTELLMASDFASQPGIGIKRHWASLFGVPVAEADGIFVDPDVVFSALIRKGADLFINETFDGNGRTCASCHPLANNTTIDPAFIATLPDDDPLFVAETNPALVDLENPTLMRQFGLILENTNGFTNPPTMRGVPHTFALGISVNSVLGPRTGWSGDGSPDLTLRSFATGAVRQHFPKTLARIAGQDFREPTDAELDAMLAFQLSLGRNTELTLPLALTGTLAKRGQEIFRDNQKARCNVCHLNAGANANFGVGNFNFNTGVENLPDQPADLTGQPNPPDDGFGNPGNGTFNTPVLVEAADTGPFFHNNAIQTIEGAVAFYSGAAFNNSPATAPPGGPIQLDATEVEHVAAFLRVINALENIRSAVEAAQTGRTIAFSNPQAARELLNQAKIEAGDAIEVLYPRGLHPDAVQSLYSAVESFERATRLPLIINRNQIDAGLGHLATARADMVQ